MKSEFKSSFAENIFKHKYALTQSQTWREKCRSIIESVCGVGTNGKQPPLLSKDDQHYLTEALVQFKWMPGGRYIYYAGRPARFWNNCYGLAGLEDSREEWANLTQRALSCLMTGGGIGVDYSVFRSKGRILSKTGGAASGPLPLAMIINEVGRNVCQGGSRRSAIYGSLNWQHDDIQEFLVAKNWFNQPIGKAGYTVADAKMDDFNYPAPLDMTNISVNYDDAWLDQIRNGDLPEVYQANVLQALKTGEPGFSFNFGAQEKYTIRNAPVCAETMVMTDEGYRPVSELIDKPSVVWTGKQWAKDVVFSCTGLHQPIVKVTMTNGRVIRCEPSHRFFVDNGVDLLDGSRWIYKLPACTLNQGDRLVVSSPSIDNEDDLNDVRVESVEEDGFADVYCADVGVEEHSFMAEGVILSNCTEFITDTDSDVCNLASLNFGGIETLEEFKQLTNTVSKFLICGSVRSQLPYQKAYDVRSANRRIGLGLMGIHEWLLKRGYGYEVVSELHEWLSAYQYESESGANEHCDRFYLNRPKAYRAIAPTGTIAILAGTTTGIEPLFATAYKRRYLVESNHWRYEYVVDSVAELLIKQYGFDPDTIETAASLASNPEKRLKFQSDVQSYVDMGVSSTVNLPAWGSELNNEDKVQDFSKLIAKYAHGLRGLTFYPDGSRGGQPITPVSYKEAIAQRGVVFEENSACKDGVCGI